MSTQFIRDCLTKFLVAMESFAHDAESQERLLLMARMTTEAMQTGGKLLVAGSGGSAADAQRIAGEFVSRLRFDQAPLPALALTVENSVLTAAANDRGYASVFERQVLALGKPGDVFLGISTSGCSPDVLRALAAARQNGLVTLGFTGAGGAAMVPRCDLVLHAPSTDTWIIQQIHITAAHILCALVEAGMFPASAPIPMPLPFSAQQMQERLP